MSDFLQGGILAILSGVLGYWGGFLLTAQQRRRRRAAIATALLSELQVLERIIRRLSQTADAATDTAPLFVDVHDQFQPELYLFKPDTISALIELRGFIRDMNRTREEAGLNYSVADSTHGWFRFKAGCAANVIPIVKACLEKEGGITIPEVDRGENISGGEVTLGPPAFGE